VINHNIERFVELTSEIWKGFNQNARLYNSAGEDSVPCKEDQIILVKIDGTGKYVAIGVLTESKGAKPGEKIFFARGADAKIVSKISMLNDGSIKTEADGGVSYTAKGAYNISSEKGIGLSAGEDITAQAGANATIEAAEKATVNGMDVELDGKVKARGGSFECNGTASPTGSGCLCAMPFCAFTGAPQTGNKAEGT
jgi:hypothetical protein